MSVWVCFDLGVKKKQKTGAVQGMTIQTQYSRRNIKEMLESQKTNVIMRT